VETLANTLQPENLKPLLDKFNDLLAIDVYFYTGLLKTKLLTESGAYELVEIESEAMEEIINNNPTNHNNFKKKNKKGLKLLIDHYNNLFSTPIDKSDYKVLYDAMWDLEVDIGQIYILLSVIHVIIPLTMKGGINLIKASEKVFNAEQRRREAKETEGLYV
jgi:hypothetical protein